MARYTLLSTVLTLCPAAVSCAGASLPVGSAPRPVEFPHFPDRLHAFIWRNWPIVEAARLAKVLSTSAENVASVARSMGLPPQGDILPEWHSRGYITVLRRNWHLLPYEQLLILLDVSAEELAYSLREDDFLFIKLGRLKPKCPPLAYTRPDKSARRRAAEIKRIVEGTFGDELAQPQQPRFSFVEALSRVDARRPESGLPAGRFGLRFIYSYFAMYGDPLMDPPLDPYPDGLLQKLSDVGVNGVWLHTVLRTLAPSDTFPEFGRDHEKRLDALRRIARRARRCGIGVYLYVNEPRAMPEAFFKDRPQMKGVREGDHIAMCTSCPQVRQWIGDSLAYVFEKVPDLAGVFTITASENLTNCASHHRPGGCPRCQSRSPADIIAEINATIENGVHRGNPDAKVIVWDWGWRDDWAADIIARLPKSVWLMSVSEWSKPITRGGVKQVVGEYSISAVGPGPRAARRWALARRAGLKTVAKVQINNSWELSAVPYLPVLDLIAEHAHNLASARIDGMMLSWTVGGHPSPNLEVAQQFSRHPLPTQDEALDRVAVSRFGPEGASHARRAWTAFSKAFREYPFHIGVVYRSPAQYGPSNLLYAKPTHYRATMIGFPYDDINGWRGGYPVDVFADQFSKVARQWQAGLPHLERAVATAPAGKKAAARAELRFAQAAALHFASVANQTRFTAARDGLLSKAAPAAQRKELLEQIKRIAQDEAVIARQLMPLARQDSRIGYEASNHYYYLPIDLMEKVINCRYIIDHVVPGME